MTSALSASAPFRRAGRWSAALRDPWLFAIFVLLTVSLVIFAALPVVAALVNAGITEDGFSWGALWTLLTARYVWEAMGNTLILGVVSGSTATVIGFVIAFGLTRTAMRGKRVVHALALLPIVTPPFVLAIAVILLFGRSGAISAGIFGIRANVYGFQSLVLIQTLAFTPIAYLNIRGMLLASNTAIEDASASLGASAWRTFRRVTLPLSMPAVVSAFLLVFVKAIEDFGNPLVIGGGYNVLAVQAYNQIIGLYNLQAGSFLAGMLLLPALLAFFVQRYWAGQRSYVTVTGKPAAAQIRLVSKRVTIPFEIFCALFGGTILLFYGTVLVMSFVKLFGVDNSFTLAHYQQAFTRGLKPLMDTLLLGGIATPTAAVLGVLIAYLLVRRSFPGTSLLRWTTLLSYAAPGTIVGIGFIIAFNDWPLALTGTGAIIVIVMVVRNIQVGIESGTNQLRQIDPSLDEASRILGASNGQTFRRVTLPLLRPTLFTAAAYTFTRSITSISAVIFLVSAHWSLITVTILAQVEQSQLSLASAYGVILIAIVLTVLGLLQLLLNFEINRK